MLCYFPRYANDLLLFTPHVLSPVHSMCRASLTPRDSPSAKHDTCKPMSPYLSHPAQSSQLPTRMA